VEFFHIYQENNEPLDHQANITTTLKLGDLVINGYGSFKTYSLMFPLNHYISWSIQVAITQIKVLQDHPQVTQSSSGSGKYDVASSPLDEFSFLDLNSDTFGADMENRDKRVPTL